jgi:hypothetical protein
VERIRPGTLQARVYVCPRHLAGTAGQLACSGRPAGWRLAGWRLGAREALTCNMSERQCLVLLCLLRNPPFPPGPLAPSPCCCLQDMGENVLAAIQEFARVLATDPPAATAANSGGSVYFDLWGRSMVRGWVGLVVCTECVRGVECAGVVGCSSLTYGACDRVCCGALSVRGLAAAGRKSEGCTPAGGSAGMASLLLRSLMLFPGPNSAE